MNEDILIELIKEYIFHNDKLRQITHYLYENTELFESRYEKDFNHDLYDFFSGKITKYSKQINEVMGKLNEKQKAKLNYLQVIERGK